jgi:hypothetical protein
MGEGAERHHQPKAALQEEVVATAMAAAGHLRLCHCPLAHYSLQVYN